ncbi:hypothetical protein [Cellulomonas fimi]|uniref:Periplasmic copper-binding protein NosD beta helix domain-containing protein n=1 Tax=Cellulomonas fimi (strain ATCC 484 / DSM 20113 / JCM 1341 / CCUG 24087 / LMG 16345 / NBRC 15513 / NCIMB 8980 / NCTC 7547 / NRS-133) TaxID=590998 RepID=F4H1P6_CELFA|nr:hypothetical protein [Cellulomonas fimi]AEE47466.1 hypothetical protein Celf_3353 [Cellulomonas fimi ATCC 484]NNH05557.1 hypothetical protein [Cellulomonas fimi]VEH36297.1 Uncharacterised protein [Cellulomonas fimi]
MRRTWRTAAAALALAVVVTTGQAVAAAARPPGVACGDVLTGDVRLTRSLHCTTSPGLTLAAGASLDLGGHSLVGPGTGVAVVTDPTAPTTLRNGTVRGWDAGVRRAVEDEPTTAPLVVDRLVVRDTGTGLGVELGATLDVRRSRFVGNGTAVSGFYGTVDVADSVFVGNQVGASVSQGRLTVTGSRFTDDVFALDCGECALTLARSTVTGSDRAVYGYGSGGARIEDNVFTRNRVVLSSEWSGTPDQVLRNRFADNDVAVEALVPMHLEGNVFVRNRLAVHSDDHERGYFAEPVLTLVDNRFDRNGDAVYTTFPATLQGTVAVRSTGYGIYAPLATDLGGNVAYGNGTEPQCTGVVCAGRS